MFMCPLIFLASSGPKIRALDLVLKGFGAIWGRDLGPPKRRSNEPFPEFINGPFSLSKIQGPLNGGVSNGRASRSGLVLPFLSFFVLFGTFPICSGFSRFARGLFGDFPD